MSTRCTTHFRSGGTTEAIIYRHSDGYPDCAGVDLLRFLAECKNLPDSRLNQPSYLAAKYVVFLADIYNYKYDQKLGFIRPESRLDFLSVGVVMEDPGDIVYRYEVDCGAWAEGLPTVSCFDVSGGDKYWVPILKVS